MSLELMAKGALASLLYRRLALPMWFVLPVVLIVDWAVLGAAAYAAAGFFGITTGALKYVGAAIALSWPGTVLQLVGVPLGVAAIERRLPRLALARGERR